MLSFVALVFIGTDFHDTPLTDLEKFEAASAQVLNTLSPHDSFLEGVVVLATCNRFEIYFEAESFHDSMDYVTSAVATALGVSSEVVTSMLKVLYGDSVPQHLFSVAAGLESMIVGEEEISGQVKRSLSLAHQRGYVSKNLNHLFQNAASVAKAVTTETGLGASGRSVITTALDVASEELGGIAGKSVLLIGTGAYSRVVSAAIQRQGVDNIFVYSRAGRAEKFSENHETTPVSKEQLVQVMAEVDLVISASGAPGYAVDVTLAQEVLAYRSGKSDLVLIDVSLSKDVAPEVSQLEQMSVIDLEQIKHRAPQEHIESVLTAREIIHTAVTDFENSMASRSIDPVVAALRSHIGLWVDEEIESVRRKSGNSAAEEVQKSLRKVTNAILHAPSVKAKELAVDGNHDDYINAVRLLFNIEVNEGG
ncbi:glutamyl-tRNA reductase [Aurantimicrobium minutum]|uniref:Glutamyl-tRNA reductase n=1 Tax=Aurantimicrobium photophilum TaxID=1987356 RepID=A0A2Z3RUY7_9MICO|nr:MULTISPECIES: glutamyl-tRNA reductase [Aurantimicrobium]AWR20735.1 Glutamyl-tRNA reductase [Aurantimicrobium photophilum]MDH6207604.1 glutamyl-tRNA reductase [Aurantimicrobium minutum]MDH6254719.1 glutamyl-tRNA reductase [Aurantimicrobium minutum]MDH6277756.1 glutamyl-tRNA reductase [Aurantimicrobium minutum]MDH6409569.1 glutamyl-tRNA reductase [Aurantimicrobium minutum]